MGHQFGNSTERDLLEIKKRSLKKIGIDLIKQTKVEEHDEKS